MATPLHEERLELVHAALLARGARRVLDLGCGEGDFLLRLVADPQMEHVTGVELSRERLARLKSRLEALPPEARAKTALACASMTDAPAGAFDCAVMIETIEHLALSRLPLLEQALFHVLRPETVIITTPNAEYNGRLGVPAHRFRHREHCFEWSRAAFQAWARQTAGRAGYGAGFCDVGGVDPVIGGASQMALFIRHDA